MFGSRRHGTETIDGVHIVIGENLERARLVGADRNGPGRAPTSAAPA